MFVGEGPGADEDEQGIPFVGRAGQLLTQIVKAMGYERDAVYIANVVKCRPPGNRNPEPDEIEQCDPFLMRQIEAVSPRVPGSVSLMSSAPPVIPVMRALSCTVFPLSTAVTQLPTIVICAVCHSPAGLLAFTSGARRA